MQRALSINYKKCTGCLQCEMICSLQTEGLINPSRSRIRVFPFHAEGRFVPYTCTQCNDAWCMTSCPVGAISADADTGARIVNASACVGCKICVISCPFGTVNYNASTGKVQKCDLCGGNPACVKSCPTGAITYVDTESVGLERMREWASKSGPELAETQG